VLTFEPKGSNSYYLRLSYARFLSIRHEEAKLINGSYRDAEVFIEKRTDDFLFYTIKDVLDYLQVWCIKDNDERAQLIMSDLRNDHASLLKMPHLVKCHFIRDSMIPMIELLIPINYDYARININAHLASMRYVVGFELTWKSNNY